MSTPVNDLTRGSAELEAFRDSVRNAVKRFDTPITEAWETVRHVPRDAVADLAAHGLFRERWAPGAYAGLGHMTVLVEELFRCNGGLALASMGHCEVFIGALARHGSAPAHARLLEDALSGHAVGCFAATEPQGGASLAGIQCRAVATGDGWHLTGTKRYISNIGSATHVLVLARADSAREAAELCLFVVPVDAPGVTIDGFFDSSGVRSCDVGQLTMDVRLPPHALLGSRGLGLLYASHLLQFERLAICSLLLSGAEWALELAAGYARYRHTSGGRVIDKQVIRHRLAMARADLWNLQSRLSEIIAFADREQAMPPHQISALKLTAGQRVGEIVDMAMQVFGARGTTSAFPLERLWRDCRIARIGGGTDEVLADVVASALDRPARPTDEFIAATAEADQPALAGRRGGGHP
jgi:alkylation response protein AidB-like acyl-CoA dehydrogenase